jgi:tripeptidyl-peptidase I
MIIPNYGRLSGTIADFSTAGGFSNYFSRPSFQDEAVGTYFSEHDPGYPYYEFNGIDFSKSGSNIGANGGIYNRIGRGFPDVSANGLNFPIIFDGYKLPEGGTSQAAPIWGSVSQRTPQFKTVLIVSTGHHSNQREALSSWQRTGGFCQPGPLRSSGSFQ